MMIRAVKKKIKKMGVRKGMGLCDSNSDKERRVMQFRGGGGKEARRRGEGSGSRWK